MGQRGEQYDNTNRGALFKNDRKQTDKQPDYTGKIELGDDVIAAAKAGKPLYLSAWVKPINTGQRQGEKMLSLSIQPPREQQGQGNGQQQQQGQGDRSMGYQRPQQQKRSGPPEQPFGDGQEFKEDDIPF